MWFSALTLLAPLMTTALSNVTGQTLTVTRTSFETLTTTTTGVGDYILQGLGASSTGVTIQASCAYTDLDCFDICDSYTSSCTAAFSKWYQSSDNFYSTYWPTDSSGYSFSTNTVTSFDGEPETLETVYYTSYTPYTTSTEVLTLTLLDTSYVGSTVIYTTYTKSWPAITYTYSGGYTYAVGVNDVSTATSVMYEIQTLSTAVPIATAFSVPSPACNASISCTKGPNPVCTPGQCTIYGGTVQLLYWPVSKTTASLILTASRNVTAYTANITALTTPRSSDMAIYQGTTLHSPSVYISFATIYAEDNCNQTVGAQHTGSIIGLHPTDLSSALGNYHALITLETASSTTVLSMYPASFDLADLNWPYNPYGWEEQLRCRDYIAMTCPVIVSGEYRPIIVVPSAIRSLDRAWATCALDWQGLYDPPTALTAVSAEATPTVPLAKSMAKSTSVQAAPSPTQESPTPSATVPPTPGTLPSSSQSLATAEPVSLAGSQTSSQETPSQSDNSKQTSGSLPSSTPSDAVILQTDTMHSNPTATTSSAAATMSDSGVSPASSSFQTSSQEAPSQSDNSEHTSGSLVQSTDPRPSSTPSDTVTLQTDPMHSNPTATTSGGAATTSDPGDLGLGSTSVARSSNNATPPSLSAQTSVGAAVTPSTDSNGTSRLSFAVTGTSTDVQIGAAAVQAAAKVLARVVPGAVLGLVAIR
ncbi:hypothetical protein LTR08_007344 [Meristemomyces frigidus]|nr:hypothetical protein LTR08_007344 [Meristemomyces frigidus]